MAYSKLTPSVIDPLICELRDVDTKASGMFVGWSVDSLVFGAFNLRESRHQSHDVLPMAVCVPFAETPQGAINSLRETSWQVWACRRGISRR